MIKNKYIVLPAKPLDKGVFEFVVQSEETCVRSIDGNFVMLKFPVEIQKKEDLPKRAQGLWNNVMNNEEAKALRRTKEWSGDLEI